MAASAVTAEGLQQRITDLRLRLQAIDGERDAAQARAEECERESLLTAGAIRELLNLQKALKELPASEPNPSSV